MAHIPLKSLTFRRERQDAWRELDDLVTRWEMRGPGALTHNQLMRLPGLYRAALSSLSVARSISLDRNALEYLEALGTRAYLCLHGTRTGAFAAAGAFFGRHLPAGVRGASLAVALAALALLFGIGVGFGLTLGNDAWFFTFVSDELAAGRTPDASDATLRDALYVFDSAARNAMKLFASFLFTHNAQIGMMCFALGIAFGIPVLLLLFVNGAGLGALAAVYHERGLLTEFGGWIAVHGTTELLAVCLCGGAGLMTGWTLAFPGRRDRLAALADSGRRAARLVLGAVILFFVAALLEAFARQLIYDDATRYAIGGASLALWLTYFATAGRRRRS